MLLVAAIFKGAQNAINALKSDIHVQYMVNGAKLQMQGILSKSDTLVALAGKISGILKCVEGSFTAEAMAYLEQYLTAEKGSRFLEVVRKLEKELGDKMPQLDTAKAKRIVESLDDGKSVDDVVAELKQWCESGKASPRGLTGHAFEDYLTDTIGGNGTFKVGGREFDGGVEGRWWEAKSGHYWDMIESKPTKWSNFKSDMGHRLKIAKENNATLELFSNTPIPDFVKDWLTEKGIIFTELLD